MSDGTPTGEVDESRMSGYGKMGQSGIFEKSVEKIAGVVNIGRDVK